MRTLPRHPNCYKKFVIFFSYSIRMSSKSVNVGDKNLKKVNFTKTKKYLRYTRYMLVTH